MQICELGALAALPNSVVQKNLNRPMRHHVAGTMLVCSALLTLLKGLRLSTHPVSLARPDMMSCSMSPDCKA